uniref:Zinc knuckle n=1 Tax=Nothobranchius furzeri TaxID=105023 RepID=A0A1A8US25_NOTFU
MTASYKISKPKFREEKRYFSGECFICEKAGHKARDCRDKVKKLRQKVVGAHSSHKVVTVMDTGQVIHNTKDKRKPAKEEEEYVLRLSEWKPHRTEHRPTF